jgi:hypothetical protein
MYALIGICLFVAGLAYAQFRRRDFNLADLALTLACVVGGIGIFVESVR